MCVCVCVCVCVSIRSSCPLFPENNNDKKRLNTEVIRFRKETPLLRP